MRRGPLQGDRRRGGAAHHGRGHGHSPACLSIELRNADTKELLCRVEPRLGKGDEAMDEEG